MTHLRRLIPDEWELVAAVRLRSLSDAPEAFTPTYAHEAAHSEGHWRSWFDTAWWFLAMDADRPTGLVGGMPGAEECFLIIMWGRHVGGAGGTRPTCRRTVGARCRRSGGARWCISGRVAGQGP